MTSTGSSRALSSIIGWVLWLLLAPNPVHSFSSTEPKTLVALVTGSNKGIGKEIAKKLISEGITNVLACRSNGKETAAELNTEFYCSMDLTDDDSIKKCKEYVETTFGKLDILCNNAAICFNDPTLYGKVPHTTFQQQADITVRTNFFGTVKVTQNFLPLLQRASLSSPSRPARIINIASAAGRLAILRSQDLVSKVTEPSLTIESLEEMMKEFVTAVESGTHSQQGWPNTCYGMSKLGIIAYTKILARDYPDLLVNSVDPGYCATDQNNHQGIRPAERGAVTPALLATTTDTTLTGIHWFDEQEIPW